MDELVRDAVLEAIEVSLDAQLRAVRRLRKAASAEPAAPKRGRSQVDMVYDVLIEAGRPLHVREILAGVEGRFSAKLDPDSVVSALTKYVVRGERFVRPAKNTFGVLRREDAR